MYLLSMASPARGRLEEEVDEADDAGEPEEHQRPVGLEEDPDTEGEHRREVHEEGGVEAGPRAEQAPAEQEEKPRRPREQDDEGPAERQAPDLARQREARGREQDRERRVVEVSEARVPRAREVVGFAVAEARRRRRGETEPRAERDEPENGRFG